MEAYVYKIAMTGRKDSCESRAKSTSRKMSIKILSKVKISRDQIKLLKGLF